MDWASYVIILVLQEHGMSFISEEGILLIILITRVYLFLTVPGSCLLVPAFQLLDPDSCSWFQLLVLLVPDSSSWLLILAPGFWFQLLVPDSSYWLLIPVTGSLNQEPYWNQEPVTGIRNQELETRTSNQQTGTRNQLQQDLFFH